MGSPGITPFGAHLAELLVARGLSLRAFAVLVRVDPSAVLYAKRSKMAVKRIGPWADVLGLSGAQREHFEFLAWCTHTPPLILERLRQLEAQAANANNLNQRRLRRLR